MALSQNGFEANNRSLIHDPVIPGTDINFPGGLRRGAVTTVLIYVAAQLHERVESAHASSQRDEWGYAERDIRGSTSVSNHASGSALDWNATLHPLGQEGTFSHSQQHEIEKILGEVEHVVRWGGNYSGRKDEMHFEVNASLGEVERVAQKLGEEEVAAEDVWTWDGIPVPDTYSKEYRDENPNFQGRYALEHIWRYAHQTNQRVNQLTKTVDKLTDMVAAQSQVSPEQFRRILREEVVNVDVDVNAPGDSSAS